MKTNKMNYKKFENILKENGYRFRDREGPKRIEESIAQYLKDERVAWFGEFDTPFLGKSISTYLGQVSSNQESFGLGNIYKILRENHEVPFRKSVKINPPSYLINEMGFNEVQKKGQYLHKKRVNIPRKKSEWSSDYYENDIFRGAKRPITYPLTPKMKKQYEKEIAEHPWFSERIGDLEENLAKEYLSIAGRLPIAYLDSNEAIDFFETETGILFSKPKEEGNTFIF